MPRHVLLMLSSAEPPPPCEEVQWHAAWCAIHPPTYFITTRPRFTGLTPDESEIAFFGDNPLHHEYLGKGVFLEYIPSTDPRYDGLITASPLYSPPNMAVGARTPENAQGMIRLRNVTVAGPNEGLESLNGIIDADGASHGRPLNLQNVLARCQASIQTYYRRADANPIPN